MSAARLHDLSPLAILSRGYAVCFAADGRTVVKTPQQVSPGDDVGVRVGGGFIDCTVKSTRTEG